MRAVLLVLLATLFAGCASDGPEPMFLASEVPDPFSLVPIEDPMFDDDFLARLGMTSNPGSADFSWRESLNHAGWIGSRIAIYADGDFVAIAGYHTFPDAQTASKWALQETHCDESPMMQLGRYLIFFEPLGGDWRASDGPGLRAMVNAHMARTGSVDLCSSTY